MRKHITALTLFISLIIGLCPNFRVNRAAAAEAYSPSSDSSAYILFGSKIESRGMHFVDGQEQGITDPAHILYNSTTEVDGHQARYYLPENQMHILIDDDFFEPGDTEFLLTIKYYDYGPTWDTINVDYNSCDPNLEGEMRYAKRLEVKKPGGSGMWRSESFHIKDADFVGGLPYEADIRLGTRERNGFGFIELVNISKARREEGSSVPNLSNGKLNMCLNLGLYDAGLAENRQYEPISKEEAVAVALTATGHKKEAVSANAATSVQGVTASYAPFVGYAQKHGYIITNENWKPQEPITKRELLALYWSILGYDSSYATAEDAEQKAISTGLAESTDFIFQLDGAATRSHMASVASNCLSAVDKRTGKPVIGRLIENEVVTREKVRETENAALNRALDQYAPWHLPSYRVKDLETGRTINILVFEVGQTVRTYMTSQMFTDDGKRFIVGNALTGSVYEYNMETEMIRYLDRCYINKLTNAVIQPGDIMYYQVAKSTGHEIWRMDLNTYEKEKKADVPYGVSLSIPTVSNDEKYFSGNFIRTTDPSDFHPNGNGRGHIAARLDLETGEWDLSMDKIFPVAPTHLCHQMINPVYTNLVLFAHEGNSDLVDDRVWIADFETREFTNVYKQAYDATGTKWEAAGHETWSEDGEWIYFCSPWRALDQRVGRTGIIRVSKDGKEREYLNNDYNYNHSFTSADQNWVVADTFTQNGSRQEVILFDTRTYKSYMLASKFPYEGTGHPHHAHPVISRDNRHASWGQAYAAPDGSLTLGCAWMNIEDLTSIEMIGGREEISDEFTKYSYIGTQTETEKTEYKGIECFKTPAGSNFYLDYNNDLLWEGQVDKTFRITYLDKGYQDAVVRYTSHWIDKTDYTKREDKRVLLPRNNTGKWITKEFTLTDAAFLNVGKHRSDLVIAAGFTDLYVKSIELVK